jgi:YbbR domain-containing protein
MRMPALRPLGLKILAIALATLLWLSVAGEQTVERALRVALEFTNVPPDLELVGDAPSVVDIRVRGSSGALSRIGPGELVALLDLRAARTGPRLFHLNHADVRTPFGVQVVQVTPSNLWITLEQSASKVVPVVPEVDGEPAEGFIVGTIAADPPTVEVVGPAGAVDRLTIAITEPVSVRGAREAVREDVNVGTANPSIRLREPIRARVTVQVTRAPIEWSVVGVPVRLRGGTMRARVVPSAVTVRVRGPREAMTHDADQFDAWVEPVPDGRGQQTLTVRVVAPAAIAIVEVDPPDVRVRIE